MIAYRQAQFQEVRKRHMIINAILSVALSICVGVATKNGKWGVVALFAGVLLASMVDDICRAIRDKNS